MLKCETHLRYIQKKRWNHPLFWLLVPLSYLYWLGDRVNNFLTWRRNIPATIVSIGNLVAGGGGKTTFTRLLASRLPRAAIVSRSFGSIKGPIGFSKTALPKVQYVGDEPLLLAKANRVFTAKKKWKAAKLASDLYKTLLVDDGLQHYALRPTINIICVNEKDPFSNGYYLPAGMLRTSPKALQKADYIVVTNCGESPPYEGQVIGMRYELENETLPKRAVAFCGIGNPEGFYELLKRHGVELIATTTLPDHATVSKEALDEMMKHTPEAILCTEKDFVKISRKVQCSYPLVEVRIKPVLHYGEKYVNELVERLNT